MIIVNGVLKELATSLLEDELLMSFTRIFVLRPYAQKQGVLNNCYEYKILNEQLHLRYTLVPQKDAAFKFDERDVNKLEIANRDLMPTEYEDKQANLLIFKELTEMNSKYSAE